MKKLILITIILQFLTFNLKAKNYSDCDSISFGDFKFLYDLAESKGTTIPIELSQPYNLRILDNNHFLYSEWNESPMLRIISIDSLDCMGYINFGFGQFDMNSIREVQLMTDSTLTVFDGVTGKLFELKWIPPMELQLISANQFNKNAVFNLTKKGKNEFIWTGNNNTDFLCHYRDTKGKVKSFSILPDIPHEENVEVMDYDIQTRLIWNEDKKRLITAAISWDIITIYDENLNLIKRFRGPVFIDSKLRDNKGVTHVPYPSFHGLSGGIQMSESGFSVAYGGMNTNEDDKNNYLKYILNFDWNGNPLSIIKSDVPAIGYSYDIDTNHLLIITEENGKPTLRQFFLSLAQKD